MDDRPIQKALETALAGLGYPVLPENTKKAPPEGVPYIRSTFAPAGVAAAAIGVSAKARVSGAFLVDVFDPVPNGPAAAAGMAAGVLAAFQMGTVLTSGTVSVTIIRAYRSAGFVDDGGFYQVPISIEWRADIDR